MSQDHSGHSTVVVSKKNNSLFNTSQQLYPVPPMEQTSVTMIKADYS